MDTLVDVEWLAEHINDANLVLLDCTVCTVPHDDGGFHNVSGRPDYELGHIPGAGFADLTQELSDLQNPVEFTPPTAEALCEAMGRLGVGDDSVVVLYDTNYTAWAARVWWMLRSVGFDRAAILDGGMAAWTASRRPLSIEPVERAVNTLTPSPRPELIVDKQWVLDHLDNPDVCLIDTLPPAFYRGDASIYARPGHIPGAININGLDLLDKTGHIKPTEQLAELHKDLKAGRYVTYCGGGIVASLNAFVMLRLGLHNIAVYTASLQEWAEDPDCPMSVTPD